MAISNKKAVAAAKILIDFCEEQRGCQNCIFRKHGADPWYYNIEAFDLREVMWNIEVKKKKITATYYLTKGEREMSDNDIIKAKDALSAIKRQHKDLEEKK